MCGGSGGGGGGGEAELAAAEVELKSLNDQLSQHRSRVPGEPSKLEEVMNPDIAAERRRLNEAWKAKDAELSAKYSAAREKVQSLKSPQRLAKEAAEGEKRIKEMQERGAREARDKIMRTGIYKPTPKRKLTAKEKRINYMLEHIDD